MTVSIWCVGMCLVGGGHKFCIFDDDVEADQFMNSIRRTRMYQGAEVKAAHIWEM